MLKRYIKKTCLAFTVLMMLLISSGLTNIVKAEEVEKEPNILNFEIFVGEELHFEITDVPIGYSWEIEYGLTLMEYKRPIICFMNEFLDNGVQGIDIKGLSPGIVDLQLVEMNQGKKLLPTIVENEFSGIDGIHIVVKELEPLLIMVGQTLDVTIPNFCYECPRNDEKGLYHSGTWKSVDDSILKVMGQTLPGIENLPTNDITLLGVKEGMTYIALFYDGMLVRMMQETLDYTDDPTYCGRIPVQVIEEVVPTALEGIVEIWYIGEDGKPIAVMPDPVILKGEIGSAWSLDGYNKQFDGYSLVNIPQILGGEFTDEKQIVKYFYKKIVVEEKPVEKPIVKEEVKRVIPNTGISSGVTLYSSTIMTLIGSLYMFTRKKRK